MTLKPAAVWIRCDVTDGVAIITIDRPPANALDASLVGELSRAVASAAQDGNVGAVVLTGSERHFVAGADITMLRHLSASEFQCFVSSTQRAFADIEAVKIPTIAAVNGHAMGGGLELALACDVRIVSEEARVGLPEVKLGLLPGAGGTQRLVEVAGKGRALDLLYSGRPLNAHEALAFGIADRVVPARQVLSEATSYGAALARGPRAAHAAIKGCVLAHLDGGRLVGARTEIDRITELFQSGDAAEGIAAFVEKRPPAFGVAP